MNYVNRSNDYWIVRIPAFSDSDKADVVTLAKRDRRSIGSYIGALLERELADAREEKAQGAGGGEE